MKASQRGWPIVFLGAAWVLGAGLIIRVPAGNAAAAALPVQVPPDAYVFIIMNEVRQRESRPLWPGFAPRGIPVAIFDDSDTGMPRGAKRYFSVHP